MRATRKLTLGLILVGLGLSACGGTSKEVTFPPRPTPTATPKTTPNPAFPFGVLKLMTVAPPPGLAPPYAAGKLGQLPGSVKVAKLLSPLVTANLWAAELGVPGQPFNTGSGLAYNLNGPSGYLLTISEDLTSFNYAPFVPIDRLNLVPGEAASDTAAENFIRAHGLDSHGMSLSLVAGKSIHYGRDRKIYFNWSEGGLPLVNMNGVQLGIMVSVTNSYPKGIAMVEAISGSMPIPVGGTTAAYSANTSIQLLAGLNSGKIDPNAYFLKVGNVAYPATKGTAKTTGVLSGGGVGVVSSNGYAVPVVVFRVTGRSVAQFVVCAEVECGPATS